MNEITSNIAYMTPLASQEKPMDIIKLNHNQHAATIRDLLDNKKRKAKAEADARACAGLIRNLRTALFLAMKGSAVARCGQYLLTIKAGKTLPGKLTLHDGRSVPLADIKHLTLNNGQKLYPEEIKTWYGGATYDADLEINDTEGTN